MSRRLNSLAPEERASLGDVHVNEAVASLTKTCRATVALMTNYGHSREGTFPMLFHDDDVKKLAAVVGLVRPSSNNGTYEVQPDCKLTIDFEDAMIPPPTLQAFSLHPTRSQPLLEWIRQVKGIHEQFEEVKYVLRWLNRNATPGAIRYYFPSAMKLCPESPAFKDMETVPTRYSVPPGISARLQMLRDAATCVASSLLLPNTAQAKGFATMLLTIEPYTVIKKGADPLDEVTYPTDGMVYNL